MFGRIVLLCAYLFVITPVVAEVLGPEQSVHFVEQKIFEYTCFNRIVGEGRILGDGSVIGNFQLPDGGKKISAALPPGTIKLEEGAVCARLAGLLIRPCFKVDKIDDKTFRGSIVGLDFAYCIFREADPRTRVRSTRREVEMPHGKSIGLKSLSASTLY